MPISPNEDVLEKKDFVIFFPVIQFSDSAKSINEED